MLGREAAVADAAPALSSGNPSGVGSGDSGDASARSGSGEGMLSTWLNVVEHLHHVASQDKHPHLLL